MLCNVVRGSYVADMLGPVHAPGATSRSFSYESERPPPCDCTCSCQPGERCKTVAACCTAAKVTHATLACCCCVQKGLFTDTSQSYWGKFGAVQQDIVAAYSGNAEAGRTTGSVGTVG
jgi:hypothetical protein